MWTQWREWCEKRGFADGDTVHETKQWLYVHENLCQTSQDGLVLTPRLQKPRGKQKRSCNPTKALKPVGMD